MSQPTASAVRASSLPTGSAQSAQSVRDNNGVEWKFVSQKRYEEAWDDLDNRNVLYAVARRFRRHLSPDEIDEVVRVALWRTLSRHEEGLGKKFTSNLYWWAEKEFKQMKRFVLRRSGHKSKRRQTHIAPLKGDLPRPERDGSDVEHLRGRLDMLPEEDRELLTKVYLEKIPPHQLVYDSNYTLAGLNKRLARARENLRTVFGYKLVAEV